MTVSKRLRYEVLRRDNFKCQYCGKVAAETELHADHVIPAALGGPDEPSNLVAACIDCNAGKAASSPNNDLVASLSANAKAYALEVANRATAVGEQLRLEEAAIAEYDRAWQAWVDADGAPLELPHDARNTWRRWYRQSIPLELVKYAVEVAMTSGHVVDSSKFRYMCGVINRALDDVDAPVVMSIHPTPVYAEAVS